VIISEPRRGGGESENAVLVVSSDAPPGLEKQNQPRSGGCALRACHRLIWSDPVNFRMIVMPLTLFFLLMSFFFCFWDVNPVMGRVSESRRSSC
jgi:hypothetical protein